jgi:hypothetical protein
MYKSDAEYEREFAESRARRLADRPPCPGCGGPPREPKGRGRAPIYGKLVCQHDREGYCHACAVAKGRAAAAYRRAIKRTEAKRG